MIISSKAGYDMWPGPYGQGGGSRKYVLASLDQSLSRMGLDYVDIFYSHRFDPDTPPEETLGALALTGLATLVVAGGVGANRELRARLVAAAAKRGAEVFFPELAFCTDNGAMIALAGAHRLAGATPGGHAFSVRPRWELASLEAP